MPRPSATASRFADHWVADALAGDDSLDFSVLKALVGVSPEFLTGAPEVTRERVALRCLQEVVSVAFTAEGEAGAAAEGGMLRADPTRSCEDFLLELIGEVGSSGSLEKNMLLPFSQDIQKFICIKKPALPETSLDLLKEVNPEITYIVSPCPVDQNGINKHDNDQSLCKINHDHVNADKLGCPTDSVQLQQENLTNIVNETDARNVQKGPMESTPDFYQACTSESRSHDHPQEDTIGAIGVTVRSPEKCPTNVNRNVSVSAEPAPAGCSASLFRSNIKPMSKQDVVDHTTIVRPQSGGVECPNTPHYNDGEMPHDDGTGIQSSKDPIHEGQAMQATVAPDFDRSSDALPTSTSETSHLPFMIAEPHRSKNHPNSPQHDGGEKLSQDLDDGSARIQPVEKDPCHDELTLRNADVLPSLSCIGAIQGENSETIHPPGNTTDHTKLFEQQNSDKAHLEVSCVDKVNLAPYDDGNILKKNTACGGQTALESRGFNVSLHNEISEAINLSRKNTGKNVTDIQKSCCHRSVPDSPQDGNEKRAKQASKEKILGNTMAETSHGQCSDDSFGVFATAARLSMTENMPFRTQDRDANGSVEVLTEPDLCVKCGKDGQLLKCSSCFLVAHDSCFGSSVTFDDFGQFYCPVCFYTKAAEAYQKAKRTCSEARKKLSAFLGTKRLAKQLDERPTGVQQTAASSEDHLNGCNTSKIQDNHQSEASHKDEEPGRQRKKQKTNPTSDACSEELVTEKASFGQNSDVVPMNKHCVLQNNRKQVKVAEHELPVENAEARNDNSSHETRHSSQNRCSPANQNAEADKDDGLTNSHQSEDSDEIEATSSNDSGKQSSPPWRHIKYRKARFQEKETPVPSNSKKALGCQDQQMPSPSKKRNYAYPPKRYSNPVAPTGRRSKLCWTEEEEAALREAMKKFTPKDDGPISWVQILEYGRDVFHKTRLPSDLRVKWRNMKSKSGS